MNILSGYSLPSNFMLGVVVFVLKSEEGGGDTNRQESPLIPRYVIVNTSDGLKSTNTPLNSLFLKL